MILFIVGLIVATSQMMVTIFFTWQVSGALIIKMMGKLDFLTPVERFIVTSPAQYMIYLLLEQIILRSAMT